MKIKGLDELERFLKQKKLKPLDAILANCYVCNGYGGGGRDCDCPRCPLYQFMPYRGVRDKVKMKRTK